MVAQMHWKSQIFQVIGPTVYTEHRNEMLGFPCCWKKKPYDFYFIFGKMTQPISYHSVTYVEKAMATHSSTLVWKMPWMEEPGRLQSMGSLRVGHDWVTSLSLFTFMHWIRKWQPTPVFLPGGSQARGSLMGCPLWGRTELDTTEAT